jgi:hypothetical protein
VLVRIPIAAACAVTGILLAGCSAGTISSVDVQKAIAAGFADQVGGEFAVACPTELPAQEGYTFACTVTDQADGTKVTVQVTETDGDGGFTWEVTDSTTAIPQG